MSSSFVLILIILVVLASSLYFLLQAEGGISQWPRLASRVGLTPQRIQSWYKSWQQLATSPSPTPSLNPLVSGKSRFSQGNCLLDTECFVSGCFNEVCGNQKAISTCESSPDFPSSATHTCGCLAGKCGWTKK